MRSDTRIPLLILVCLGLGPPATPAQRQGEILDRQGSSPKAADAGNTSQGMQTPVLGFVSTGAQLRPLLGIPGASAVGEPFALPAGVMGVHFEPHQNYALLSPTTGGGFIGLMTFQEEGEGAVISICGAISQPDIVAFSPSGAVAVLYSNKEERLQVISGLPNSPELARTIPANDLPDEPRFLAIADDGVTLLEGTVQNAVYLLPQVGSPRFIHSLGDLQGMAFVPRTSDVAVFDREAGAAFLLQDVTGASSYVPLAEGLTGLGGTVFLETSSASTVIASTASSSLWQINLQSLNLENIHLPGMPQMLEPLRTSGDYLLFYRSGLPAWILDSNGGVGVVSLVPASTPPRMHPRPIPLAGSLGNANEQPDLVGRPDLAAGCADVATPPKPPKPLSRPEPLPPRTY